MLSRDIKKSYFADTPVLFDVLEVARKLFILQPKGVHFLAAFWPETHFLAWPGKKSSFPRTFYAVVIKKRERLNHCE